MLGYSSRALPFSTLCDDMLAMLACATCWLYIHLYMLAHMFMHESCLLVCRPCFNTMKSWTFDPNLHLSQVDTTFCLFVCLLSCLVGVPVCLLILLLVMSSAICYALFVFLLICLYVFLFAFLLCFHVCHAYLLYASFIHSLHFLSIACLLVSCLCFCMYTHGARVRFPKHE